MYLLWIGFIVIILLLLALDLGVFNKKLHVIEIKEALLWSAFWIFLALIFSGVIYYIYEHHWLNIGIENQYTIDGKQAALQYITGYLIEKSLSLDNIFVIALIFTYFNVEAKYQHRVLFWGILGALILRGVMILAGSLLISRFEWMIYVFGAFLIFTAVKMLLTSDHKIEPDKNPLVRLSRKFYPVTNQFYGMHFTAVIEGRKHITPLFIALLVVEGSDVMFAIDSIPAIFAITKDPFIVFTSNIFAILGLRSLYFALAALIAKFKYLKFSLVFILAYVGVKMLLSGLYHLSAFTSLVVISLVLLAGILLSIFIKKEPVNK
jgi:tellurite resistance protein TerC